jgi:rRNA-processing protein FCF1
MSDKSTRIAVDADFLLDLAAQQPDCWKSVETIRSRPPVPLFCVLPTVIDELTLLCADPTLKDHHELAELTLRSLRGTWKFQPADFVPVGHGIVEQIADKIRSQNLMPEEEKNGSYILAESALFDCAMLITYNRYLLDVDPIKLKLLLRSCEVCCPVIVSPWSVLRYF